MSDQQTISESEIKASQTAAIEVAGPMTSGYVPIVGLPGEPTATVSSLPGETTDFTVSSVEPDPTAPAATGKTKKTKGCTISFTDARQYLWNGSAWAQTTTPPLPFILNFSLNSPTTIAKDEQLQVSFTNNNGVAAKLEIDYTVGSGSDQETGTATFIRN